MRKSANMILFFLVLLTPILACADTLALPCSYSSPSANGQFLFVMIAPIEVENDGLDLRVEDRQEAQRIRATYSASGQYPNNGSTTPLWTVDWYSHSVFVASDGMHLVRLGPWARNLNDEAFTFFAHGKEIRTYKIGELVDTVALLPQSVSHFQWEGNIQLDDEQRALSVETLSGEKYVFDYTTGEIVAARRPLRGIVIAAVAFMFFAVIWLTRRRKMFVNPAV